MLILFKSFTYQSAGVFLNIFCNLFLFGYLSKSIPREAFGLLGLVTSSSGLIANILNLGLPSYNVRKFFDEKKEEFSVIFSTSFLLQIFLVLILYLLVIGGNFWFREYVKSDYILIGIALLYTITLVLAKQYESICNAEHRGGLIFISSLIFNGVKLGVLFCCIFFINESINILLYSLVCAQFFRGLFLGFACRKYLTLKVRNILNREFKEFALPVWGQSITDSIVFFSGNFLVSTYFGLEMGGIFNIAEKIVNILKQLVNVMAQVTSTYLMKKERTDVYRLIDKIFLPQQFIVFFLYLAMIACSYIVLFYIWGVQYRTSWNIVPILGLVPFMNHFHSQKEFICHYDKDTKPLLRGSLICAPILLLSYWVLLPRYGIIGLIVSNLMNLFILSLLISFMKNLNLNFLKLAFVLCLVGIVLFVFYTNFDFPQFFRI